MVLSYLEDLYYLVVQAIQLVHADLQDLALYPLDPVAQAIQLDLLVQADLALYLMVLLVQANLEDHVYHQDLVVPYYQLVQYYPAGPVFHQHLAVQCYL